MSKVHAEVVEELGLTALLFLSGSLLAPLIKLLPQKKSFLAEESAVQGA